MMGNSDQLGQFRLFDNGQEIGTFPSQQNLQASADLGRGTKGRDPLRRRIACQECQDLTIDTCRQGWLA